MSEKQPYRVFVAHWFEAHDEYQRVFEYIESRENFFYTNTSNVEAMPEGGGPEAIREELRNQIQICEAVLIPAAIYAENRDLIDFQVNCAQAFKKGVIVIKASAGAGEVVPVPLETNADTVVEWNDRQITDAIREYGRGEEVQGWDVIEFTLDD